MITEQEARERLLNAVAEWLKTNPLPTGKNFLNHVMPLCLQLVYPEHKKCDEELLNFDYEGEEPWQRFQAWLNASGMAEQHG